MSSPQNSSALPVYLIPFLAAVTAMSPLSIDVYLPAFPSIAADFRANPLDVNFTMSTYFVGFALGQLFGGPLSDQLGRKRIGLPGLMLFFIFTTLILFSQNIEQMAALRALQGLGAGFASSVVMPTIRDLSSPEKLAGRIALITLFMLLAPLVAPIIGVALLTFGWRSIFVFLCIYGGLMGAIYFLAIKETRESSGQLQIGRVFVQYVRVINHRLDGHNYSIRYALAGALSVATMMIYLTNASFLFQTYYAVETKWFPFLFALNVISFAVAQAFSASYLRNKSLIETASYYRWGHRIQFGFALALLVVTLATQPPLWLFMALLALSLGCIGLVGPSGSGIYLAAFERLSGSASSILTVGYFFLGAVIGAVTGLFQTGDLIPLSIALFCATLVANLLVLSIASRKEADILAKLSDGRITPL